MTLKQKIDQDSKKALQNREELILLVLRGVNSAIHNKEIEKKGKELTQEEILEILISEVKKRKEAIEGFKRGSRNDLVEKEQKELKILQKYLPEQIKEEEIRKEAQEIIEKIGASNLSDMGRVMSILMPKLKGRAEGGVVSAVVSKLLK